MLIIERIKESLKRQDWTAVSLELAIVIIGVFIGTQVSNWNQERIERRDTARLLQELQPALKSRADFFDTAKPYYATTRRYSDTAFAGWNRDPKVSDEQFVIAAYQASQIYTFGLDGENWAAIFGSERLRDIDDAQIRRGLANVMTFNYDQIDLSAVSTTYRQHVRQVIPIDIQDAIRAQCTDKPIDGSLQIFSLPATCDLDLPDSRFAEGASALRASPELAGELRWHIAAVASFLASLDLVAGQTKELRQAIEKSNG
jgi:hypothetical protein